MPARGDEDEHDVIALGEPGHARTDLLHDTRALMAADDRQADHEVTLHAVVIGVTQARGHQADPDLTLPRRGELDLLDAPRLVERPQNCCFSLHDHSFVST